jgi:carbon storage regulator CsrA
MPNLLLTRSEGQSISIGPDIVVQIVELRRGQARVSVSAPTDVKVCGPNF